MFRIMFSIVFVIVIGTFISESVQVIIITIILQQHIMAIVALAVVLTIECVMAAAANANN